jgi:RNA polymerase sigma-70 factor (ECF subfamily)
LATYHELSGFLAEIERRAFKQALYALHDRDLALDIVQEAMLRLTEKYASRPPEELPLLFQRILQNAIRDHYRRQKVRSLWTTPLATLFPGHAEEETDPMETLVAADNSNMAGNPGDQLQQAQVIGLIEQALETLPARQREAFLLRYWENMDVAETAAVMGCSEGSVKTHCSRATHALADMLREKGVTL